MVAPAALAGLSMGWGLLQSLMKRPEKAAEGFANQVNSAVQTGQNLPTAPAKPDAAALFKAFDTDGSGSLTKAELTAGLQSAREKGAMFSRETFGALLAAQEQSEKGKSQSNLMDKALARFDTDKDGSISDKEFLAGMPSSRSKEAKKDGLEALFNSMDKDGDGKISAEELKTALQTMTAEHGHRKKSAAVTLPPADTTTPTTTDGTSTNTVTDTAGTNTPTA
ncbi:EF-hand domain-containing protein [Alsobacter sp. R-9]